MSTKPYSPLNKDNLDEPYTEYLAQVVVVNYSGETLVTLPVGWATGETNPYSGNPMVDFDPDITAVEIGHPSAGYVGAEWNASKVSHELVEEYLFQVQILPPQTINFFGAQAHEGKKSHVKSFFFVLKERYFLLDAPYFVIIDCVVMPSLFCFNSKQRVFERGIIYQIHLFGNSEDST